MNAEKRYRSRFLVSDSRGFWPLHVEHVAYFYSEGKLTFAVASNGREYPIDQSLTCLEEELDPDHFFRVNRQVMVNIDAVDHALPIFHRKLRLSVTPPFRQEIIISEARSTAFKQWLGY